MLSIGREMERPLRYTGTRFETYETARIFDDITNDLIRQLNKQERAARETARKLKLKREAARIAREEAAYRQRVAELARIEAEREARRKQKAAEYNAKRREARRIAREAKTLKDTKGYVYYVSENPKDDMEDVIIKIWEQLRTDKITDFRIMIDTIITVDKTIYPTFIDTNMRFDKDYKKFRNEFITGGASDGGYIFNRGDKIVMTVGSKLEGKKLYQHFRDGIQHCVFEPIITKLKQKMEITKSDSCIKRYRQRIAKLSALEEKYSNGVPEDDMEEVAKISGLAIKMDVMGNVMKVWNENGRIGTLYLRNTRENHLDEVDCLVMDRDFETVSEERMAQLWNEACDMGDGKYMVEGDIKNDKPNKLHFLTKAYATENPEMDIMNDFSNSINLHNYRFNATAFPDVNEFIKAGRIINSWSSEINADEATGHIDMPKAYAQFNKCSYYAGFMGVVHQWRKGEFDATFLKNHIGMYRFNVESCDNRLYRKLGLVPGASVILPSPEILFFLDNGVKGHMDAGVWGSRVDFSFTEEMLENRRYCIWAGRCGMERTHKSYTFPGSKEWAAHLKATLPEAEVVYWSSRRLITVKVPVKCVFTLHHILAFITSYTRIQMLQAMSGFKHEDLVRVVMDGIYFKGQKPDTLDWFVEKKLKQGNSYGGWYCDSIVNVDWAEVRYKRNTMISGQGGAGKTYGILTDKCYNKTLYVVPQHVLGQKQKKEHGCNYTTIHQLIGMDCRPYIEKYSYPPIIIMDEITQYEDSWVDKAISMYPHSLILLVGDIDENGQWFQCRSGKPGNFSKIWKPTNVDYVVVGGDRRSRDDTLKALKLAVRDYMRKIFVDGDGVETHLMKRWAMENLEITSFDDACAMFNPGDTWIAGTRETSKKLLDKGICSGWYKKGGWISAEEQEGYEKKGSYTIHSYQGATITEGKIFISIGDLFEYSMLFTAISRAVHFNQLVFVN